MDNLEKNNLILLRQRVPIGLRHGQILLEKTNGDLDQAEKLFRDDAVATLSEKTGVNHDTVRKHLEEHHYDIARALRSIDEGRFTLTQQILMQRQNKLDALEMIAVAMPTQLKITRDTWLSFSDLAQHPAEIFCVLSIVEWLMYDSCEGFESALSFHADVIAHQIEQQLHLPEVAENLRAARMMYDSDRQKYSSHAAWLERPRQELQDLSDRFDCQRQMLTEALYAYVVNNVAKLP